MDKKTNTKLFDAEFWRTADEHIVADEIAKSAPDINARDKDKRTLLHFAAGWSESPAVIELLLDKGANIEARDAKCNTPLFLAAEITKTPAIIEVLLDKGANVDARNCLHMTVVFVADNNSSLKGTKALKRLREASHQ